jgi:ribosomal protein L39E
LEDVENDMKKMDFRGWIKIATDRDAWKLILKEAKVLHGPQRQWRREKLLMSSVSSSMTHKQNAKIPSGKFQSLSPQTVQISKTKITVSIT